MSSEAAKQRRRRDSQQRAIFRRALEARILDAAEKMEVPASVIRPNVLARILMSGDVQGLTIAESGLLGMMLYEFSAESFEAAGGTVEGTAVPDPPETQLELIEKPALVVIGDADDS